MAKSRGRFARNMADREERRKEARKRAEKAVQKGAQDVTTKRMKGLDGKTHTYHVKTDSRGRQRIIDTGIVAPKDYYNASGKKYYLKKKYARLSRNAPEAQKEMLRRRQRQFFDKYLDSASRQGMIAAEEGMGTLANMRKTTAAKREMDAFEAYSDYEYGHAGSRTRKASRYSVLFGQDGHCQ